MTTRGELTAGKLRKFLAAFPDETKVVLGQQDTADTIRECQANTYYPDGEEDKWPMIVIDAGEG